MPDESAPHLATAAAKLQDICVRRKVFFTRLAAASSAFYFLPSTFYSLAAR
jgi:hypothetical protein